MKIAILGTAGYHPNHSRHTTCVVIPEAGIVLDAGTALFRLAEYIQTPSIDIFLSHAHLDHVVGLTYLLDVHAQKPIEEVRVHGERAKLEAIRRHLFSPELFPVEPLYIEHPLPDLATEVVVGTARVRSFPLQHPGGSIGYRIELGERSLAFVTDTTACRDAAYREHIRGVDLLIHECNFLDGREDLARKTGHSCLTPVVELARAAQVGGLLLIHMNPLGDGPNGEDLARVQDIFSPVMVGEDGMEIDL